MSKRFPAWGAIAGTLVALAVLAWLSITLLNTDGANYKVLAAVWLWLLPATGLFAGLGYIVGKVAETVGGLKSARGDGGVHADA